MQKRKARRFYKEYRVNIIFDYYHYIFFTSLAKSLVGRLLRTVALDMLETLTQGGHFTAKAERSNHDSGEGQTDNIN